MTRQRVQWKWPKGWRKPTEAGIEYWSTIGVAVLNITLSTNDEGSELIYRLFGAGYLIIHAHGRRILAAVREERNTNQAGQS